MVKDASAVGLVTREQLLGATARRYIQFPVPGLSGEVRIQSLTEKEKAEWEASTLDKNGVVSKDKLKASRRKLVAMVVVDAEGKLVLTDDDVKALEAIDGNITNAIQFQAQAHCGIGSATLEEARKN